MLSELFECIVDIFKEIIQHCNWKNTVIEMLCTRTKIKN
jgi:hypothetical protein